MRNPLDLRLRPEQNSMTLYAFENLWHLAFTVNGKSTDEIITDEQAANLIRLCQN